MKVSSFFQIACLAAVLSSSVLAERRHRLQYHDDEPGDSRFDAYKPIVDGQPLERTNLKNKLVTTLKSSDVPDWLYVHIAPTGIKGYSVRISDRILLSPKGLKDKDARMVEMKQLPSFSKPTQMELHPVNWEDRPRDLVLECSLEAWLVAYEFRPIADGSPPFSPTDLRIMDRDWNPDGRPCTMISHRLVSDTVVVPAELQVIVICGERTPMCEVRLDEEMKGNITFEFCPEDNGAPILCKDDQLALMIHASEHKLCHNASFATRINLIKHELQHMVVHLGEKVQF